MIRNSSVDEEGEYCGTDLVVMDALRVLSEVLEDDFARVSSAFGIIAVVAERVVVCAVRFELN